MVSPCKVLSTHFSPDTNQTLKPSETIYLFHHTEIRRRGRSPQIKRELVVNLAIAEINKVFVLRIPGPELVARFISDSVTKSSLYEL